MKRLLSLCALSCVLLAGARATGEEEGETGGARVGPGKAVREASEKEGLRLSPEAVRRIGLAFRKVKAAGVQTVDSRSVARFRDEAGVYRLRAGWFKLVEVRVVSQTRGEARIESVDLKPGDQIVVVGVPFLRAAELDVFGAAPEEKMEEHERRE